MNEDDSRLKKEEITHLGQMEEKLYERNQPPMPTKRSKFFFRAGNEPRAWEPEAKPAGAITRLSGWLKMLLLAIMFFTVTIGVAWWLLQGGSNLISNRRVEIAVNGPVAVRAGDEVNLQISITNNNQTPLETANLVIEYPAGTRSTKDLKIELPRAQQSLGQIASGETVNVSAKAILLGEENTEKLVRLSLNYRVPGAAGLFEKDYDYKLVISSSPLNILADLPAEIIPGQNITLHLQAISNAETVLKNILLAIDYPPGFELTDTSVRPSFGNNIWNLGDIDPGAKREIEISGRLTGASAEIKNFHLTAGSASTEQKDKITAIFNDTYKTITLQKSLLDVDLTLDDKSASDYVIASDKQVQVAIKWVNNSSFLINNAQVELSFGGEAIDQHSVQPGTGYYQSEDNVIIWDSSTDSGLARIAPGQTGQVTAKFMAKPAAVDSGSQISLIVKMKGNKKAASLADQPIELTLSKLVKVQSNLQLIAKALYRDGPFANIGPLPPKVDQETTYTIVWELAPPTNELRQAVVRTILPINIGWAGVYLPNDEDVAYNPNSREIVWQLGTVAANRQAGSHSRQLSFQVTATPSLGNLQRQIPLTQIVEVEATDDYTGATLTGTLPALTSNLTADSGFRYEESLVGE